MNERFFEPTRSAMSFIASSSGRPSLVSVEHAVELLRRRLGAVVDDRLERLLEAVARLERRRHADEEVGELVLERLRAGDEP